MSPILYENRIISLPIKKTAHRCSLFYLCQILKINREIILEFQRNNLEYMHFYGYKKEAFFKKRLQLPLFSLY